MKTTANINNTIFIYTMLGVVLLIATMGFTLTNFSNIAMLERPYLAMAGVMGFSGISLLTKAIKADKHRLKEQVTA